ncbi:unnamed protein product [Amoebophrya sp. A25]|nr:unnamed protein product [Amoebophrya sp. A25]|eukprot:GSA25T00010417001.1
MERSSYRRMRVLFLRVCSVVVQLFPLWSEDAPVVLGVRSSPRGSLASTTTKMAACGGCMSGLLCLNSCHGCKKTRLTPRNRDNDYEGLSRQQYMCGPPGAPGPSVLPIATPNSQCTSLSEFQPTMTYGISEEEDEPHVGAAEAGASSGSGCCSGGSCCAEDATSAAAEPSCTTTTGETTRTDGAGSTRTTNEESVAFPPTPSTSSRTFSHRRGLSTCSAGASLPSQHQQQLSSPAAPGTAVPVVSLPPPLPLPPCAFSSTSGAAAVHLGVFSSGSVGGACGSSTHDSSDSSGCSGAVSSRIVGSMPAAEVSTQHDEASTGDAISAPGAAPSEGEQSTSEQEFQTTSTPDGEVETEDVTMEGASTAEQPAAPAPTSSASGGGSSFRMLGEPLRRFWTNSVGPDGVMRTQTEIQPCPGSSPAELTPRDVPNLTKRFESMIRRLALSPRPEKSITTSGGTVEAGSSEDAMMEDASPAMGGGEGGATTDADANNTEAPPWETIFFDHGGSLDGNEPPMPTPEIQSSYAPSPTLTAQPDPNTLSDAPMTHSGALSYTRTGYTTVGGFASPGSTVRTVLLPQPPPPRQMMPQLRLPPASSGAGTTGVSSIGSSTTVTAAPSVATEAPSFASPAPRGPPASVHMGTVAPLVGGLAATRTPPRYYDPAPVDVGVVGPNPFITLPASSSGVVTPPPPGAEISTPASTSRGTPAPLMSGITYAAGHPGGAAAARNVYLRRPGPRLVSPMQPVVGSSASNMYNYSAPVRRPLAAPVRQRPVAGQATVRAGTVTRGIGHPVATAGSSAATSGAGTAAASPSAGSAEAIGGA